MADNTYFLVNDTRYDNHHGGLTVVRNLHAAMAARGWTCTGSVPVSATASRLNRYRSQLEAAERVIVNGEGSLHHNGRNAQRLLEICERLQATHPVTLINTIWQDNDTGDWKPVLDACSAVYARDTRSQERLQGIGIAAQHAPDLTFYDYPRLRRTVSDRYGCTDSVLTNWTEWALEECEKSGDMDFLTLFTRHLYHTRGSRDWSKRFRYAVLVPLAHQLPDDIPEHYQALGHGVDDTTEFLTRFASTRAVCAARYHALCFALQQNMPFVAVPSNSDKIEALLSDAGLPRNAFLYCQRDGESLREALEHAIEHHAEVESSIALFNQSARHKIDAMFDAITDSPVLSNML